MPQTDDQLKKQIKFSYTRMQQRVKYITFIYQSELFDKPFDSKEIFNNEFLSSNEVLVVEKLERIIPIIKKIVTNFLDSNWPWKRISPLVRAIIIYGVFEMQMNEPKVVINEMVNITKVYSPGDDYKFVNSILDNINKHTKRND